jgi:hypothetical protein
MAGGKGELEGSFAVMFAGPFFPVSIAGVRVVAVMTVILCPFLPSRKIKARRYFRGRIK